MVLFSERLRHSFLANEGFEHFLVIYSWLISGPGPHQDRPEQPSRRIFAFPKAASPTSRQFCSGECWGPVLIEYRVLFCQPFCEIINFFCGILFFLVGLEFFYADRISGAVSSGFAKMIGLAEFSLFGENFRPVRSFFAKTARDRPDSGWHNK